MNIQTYRCQRCGHDVPINNRVMHDSRCPGLNQQNQISNYNQNMRNFSNFNNFNNFNNGNQMNNNMISMNTNSMSNPDGTMTEIRTETYQNGMRRIINTKYDQYHNKISEQVRTENLNNNNFNNNNMLMNNNNVNIQRSVDQFGNITETQTERFPNGQTRIISITRDRNGNIISQNMSSNSGGNNMNMQNFNMGMNGMNNAMNNMNNMMNGMNNMNNMNYMMNGMNNMNNNMNNMMNNMSNMMNNFNAMFNNLINNNVMGNIDFNNFNNMNNENMGNGVEPTILNNLETTKLKDISKLEDDKKNCIICMEDFMNGDEVIYLPCLHVFHNTCILEWFKRHDDCPVCKFKLTYENLNPNNQNL